MQSISSSLSEDVLQHFTDGRIRTDW